MTPYPFDPSRSTILVDAEVRGPIRGIDVQLSLDTGATMTILPERILRKLGYDPAAATIHHQLTTASGMETVAELSVLRFESLGHARTSFPVLCMNLPSSAGVDGVLGLDFFRGLTLTIDFRISQITLA